MDFRTLGERLERLYSPRLALRPVCLADTWPLYEATRNPLFNAHLLWDRPDDPLQVGDRLEAIIEAERRGELCATSAVRRSNGEWVSLFRFQRHALRPGATELGIWTHDRFWHGSYSLELGRACVDAAFEFGGARLLVGASAPANRSSCQLMTLCGLQPDRLVQRITESGREVQLLEHVLTRDAWVARRRTRSFDLLAARAERLSAPGRPVVAEEPSVGPYCGSAPARDHADSRLAGMVPVRAGDGAEAAATPRTAPATRTAAGTPAAG